MAAGEREEIDVPEHQGHVEAQLAGQWLRVRGRLQSEVGDVEYRTWLRQMTFGGFDGDEVTLRLPTRFLRDWARSHYGDRLNALWQAENPRVRRVDIRVGQVATTTAAIATVAAEPAEAADAGPTPARPEEFRERAGDAAALEPRFTFDSFVVGKPNEFAYACARRVAEQPGLRRLQPAVPLWRRRARQDPSDARDRLGSRRTPGAARRGQVAYMSAERFMYRFIAAMRSQATMEFKEQLRSVDVLMIDDLQFLIGKDTTQEEFFHTFNALVEAGKQIVVSADKSPSDLRGWRSGCAPGSAAAWWPTCTPRPTSCALASSRPRRRAPAPTCRPRCWSSSPTRSPPTCASWRGR